MAASLYEPNHDMMSSKMYCMVLRSYYGSNKPLWQNETFYCALRLGFQLLNDSRPAQYGEGKPSED